MVDTFTAEEFERALPINIRTNQKIFLPIGVVDGEYSFLGKVNARAGIMIRSSVKSDGMSAETGKDSIRVWLVDPTTLKPLGSKLSKYVTRVSGWEERLKQQLHNLYKYGTKIRTCSCGEGTIVPFKVKKDGPNKGRFFWKCNSQECKENTFEWID